ncbi:MAG TPA: penicillin-binding protein 2 [Candidatus Saccharimonadales bacterium]
MKSSNKKFIFNLPTLRIIPSHGRQTADRATSWTDNMLPPGMTDISSEPVAKRTLPLVITSVVIVLSAGLIFRLFQLQVTAHDQYAQLADGNRIRESIAHAPRGNIYDRHGRLLASNTIGYELSVTPYLLPDDEPDRQTMYAIVAKAASAKQATIAASAEGDGVDYPLPKTVLSNLSHKQALSLMQYLPDLPGWHIAQIPQRKYVADSGMAHILGYTASVDPADLEADMNSNLLPVDKIGKAGIELQYDDVLRGQNGFERTEVNTLGQPVRVLAQTRFSSGQDITLTIDLEVQRRLARELKDQMSKANVSRASAVALDPDSGEVLAMVSLPSYDNNLFARGISQSDLDKLTDDPDQPLLNKVISGGYTTGSTIKPVVASAALEEKVVTPDTIIVDSGAIAVTSVYQPGQQFVFRGWRPGGLGPMDVRRAIAWSSNIYFYTVGGGHGGIEGLGVDRLARYYRDFGLGEPSGIDLPTEITGRVPDRTWKLKNKQEDWFVGDSYNISIGQGDLLVSPLQLTLANMAVANGGYLLEPQLLLKIGDEIVAGRKVRREVDVSKKNIQIVREGMRQVLTDGTTCECTFSNVPVKVAGKSGTAQTTSDESRRPHAWFTAFAPYERPEIMITAMLEEGSGGSLYAAPAIAGAMNTYFK